MSEKHFRSIKSKSIQCDSIAVDQWSPLHRNKRSILSLCTVEFMMVFSGWDPKWRTPTWESAAAFCCRCEPEVTGFSPSTLTQNTLSRCCWYSSFALIGSSSTDEGLGCTAVSPAPITYFITAESNLWQRPHLIMACLFALNPPVSRRKAAYLPVQIGRTITAVLLCHGHLIVIRKMVGMMQQWFKECKHIQSAVVSVCSENKKTS